MKKLNLLRRIFIFEDEQNEIKPLKRELKWLTFKVLNSRIKIERMHWF